MTVFNEGEQAWMPSCREEGLVCRLRAGGHKGPDPSGEKPGRGSLPQAHDPGKDSQVPASREGLTKRTPRKPDRLGWVRLSAGLTPAKGPEGSWEGQGHPLRGASRGPGPLIGGDLVTDASEEPRRTRKTLQGRPRGGSCDALPALCPTEVSVAPGMARARPGGGQPEDVLQQGPTWAHGVPSCQKRPPCRCGFIFLTVIFQDMMTHGEKM